jgi:excisionase family DNA binding protein
VKLIEPLENDDTLLLTVPEAARQLRVGQNTIYRLIANGQLKAKDMRQPGARKGMTRIPRAELVRYCKAAPPATSEIGKAVSATP